MFRNTILKPNACDLRDLPLDAREAFVLTQIDGRSSLEEIAQIAGLELSETLRIAKRLEELGAVARTDGPRRPSRRFAAAAPSTPPKGPSKEHAKEVRREVVITKEAPKEDRQDTPPPRSQRPPGGQKNARPVPP